MPLPKPKDDESEDDFISRCMGDDLMNEEYEDEEQRSAICYQQWGSKGKSLERKTLRFEIKGVDEETGVFEGYGSTFSQFPDAYGDVVDKGAFSKTITEGAKRIKVLWNHNADEPIGKPTILAEDEHGLYIKAKLSLGVQRAREVLSLMKDGVINELSIGYETVKQMSKDGVRHLQEVKLYDVSPVSFAANEEATVMSVKNETKAGRVLSASNRTKVQAALEALQALLESAGDEEPEKSTPDPTEEKGAAELEAALAELEGYMQGFDTKDAERRIDELLATLT